MILRGIRIKEGIDCEGTGLIQTVELAIGVLFGAQLGAVL